MARHEARAGQVIADLYRLEEPLGRGGMGRIWRAEQLRLKSQVALKFLDPAISDDPETFNRFVREAQAAAAVRGAHVVQIFDCGIDEGTPYISMDLLRGESLDKRLAAQKVLAAAELDNVFTEVARAVDTAHELGIIHRDLKPGNIFLARERDREISKVLDFGIAKLMHAVPTFDSAAGTRTGTMLGTPYYMSPEQVRGRRDVDPRTDLWSLAIIAYECLTGQVPFGGDSVGDVVVQICTATPPSPSSFARVPAGFDAWFAKSTSKDPDGRFNTAGEMAERLSQVLAPASAARSPRSSSDARTLVSVPGTPAREVAEPAPSSRQTRPAEGRVRTGTAVLSASARVPPPVSTGSLTTLSSTVHGRPRVGSRARWLWVATSLAFVFGASLLVLRPAPVEPTGERGAAPERAVNDVGVLREPRLAPAPREAAPHAAVHAASEAAAPLPRPLEQVSASLEPSQPSAERPRPAAGAEPQAPQPAVAEPQALEPAALPRRTSAKPASGSRRSNRSTAQRSGARPGKTGALKPTPAPAPASPTVGAVTAPPAVDPFAERD